MAYQRTLINNKLLKEFSLIPLNYDMKEINNYVSIAEKIWIEPTIGSCLYNELLCEIEEDKLSKESNELLVEALYPLLGAAVCLEALPMMWAHISQVGITLGKSDNSDSVSLKDMTYIHNHLRNQTEVRRDYLKFYLDQHMFDFPSYMMFCKKNVPNKRRQVYGTTTPKKEIK